MSIPHFVVCRWVRKCLFVHPFVSQWNNTIPFYITRIHPVYCDHRLDISHILHTKETAMWWIQDNLLVSCLGCNIFAFIFVALVNVVVVFFLNWSNHFAHLLFRDLFEPQHQLRAHSTVHMRTCCHLSWEGTLALVRWVMNWVSLCQI